jgi:hypothetical protein
MMLHLIFHSLMFLIRGITSFWRPCDKGSYVFGLKMQTRSLVATKCCEPDALLSYDQEMREVWIDARHLGL